MIFGIDRAGPDAGYPDDLLGKPIVYLAWNHSGSADDVERDTAGLRVGPTPVTTTIGSARTSTSRPRTTSCSPGASRSFIKSHNANDIRREALDELVELVATAPGDSTFSVTALGGAIGRVPEDATAYAGRALRVRPERRHRLDRPRRSTRRTPSGAAGSWRSSSRTGRSAPTPNGNSDAGPGDRAGSTATRSSRALAALKRDWDPDNVFHVNPNVAPAPG